MAEAKILPFPDIGPARLARALARLNAALAEQAAAVRDFHTAVCDLRTEVTRLEEGLLGHRAALEDVAGTLLQARMALRRLDATADRLAAVCG